MWNSYVDKDVIDEVKQVTQRHADWFYVTSPGRDTRMRNEELLTVLAYLEYRQTTDDESGNNVPTFMDVFRREATIGVRIKQKSDVTNLLNQATVDPKIRDQLRKCVRRADGFIKRIRTILIDEDVVDPHKYAEQELTSLFNVQGKRHYARRFQDFYSLWYVTQFLTPELVNEKRFELKAALREIIGYMKNVEKEGDLADVIDEFHRVVCEFYDKYSVDPRTIRLADEEKAALIKQQNNQCSICDGPLFIHDEIEIDHSKPLAKGGKDRFLNLKVAHKHCNRKKGAK